MIYGDDNIHTAMEKIAGLPTGLRRSAKGIRSAWQTPQGWRQRGVDFSKSKVPVGQESRVMDHIRGKARARSIAQERKRMVREFGQREPKVLRADRTLADKILGRKGKPDYEGSTQALQRAVNPSYAKSQHRSNFYTELSKLRRS